MNKIKKICLLVVLVSIISALCIGCKTEVEKNTSNEFRSTKDFGSIRSR